MEYDKTVNALSNYTAVNKKQQQQKTNMSENNSSYAFMAINEELFSSPDVPSGSYF